MISRSRFSSSAARSNPAAESEDWSDALEKVAQQAAAVADSFDRLRQGLDQSIPPAANGNPTPPSPPPPPGAGDLASQLANAARQTRESFNSDELHASLADALALMNELAARVASQDDVRDLAAQVETLRLSVNTIAARSSLNRSA